MRLPLILISFLPKGLASRYMQHLWDCKTDDSILASFEDATDWIDLSLGSFESETVNNIAENCITRLDMFILPQMRKRNLL